MLDLQQLKRVAIVMGGDSNEREVSLASGAAVRQALSTADFELICCDGVGELQAALDAGGIDAVFNVLHGRGGEDGSLQGLLACRGVAVTGSGILGSALSLDKIRSKYVLQAASVPTAPFLVNPSATDYRQACQQLGTEQLIVKPALGGSTIGISKVKQASEWAPALDGARAHDIDILVEPWLPGDEVTVGFIGTQALPIVRIRPASGFYDYAAKYQADDTIYECPAPLDAAAAQAITATARQAFLALGLSGWGRIDLMGDGTGNYLVLEANTTPGMTDHSLVPKAAAAVGIDFPTLCQRILELSEVPV